jgi:hypothetical protein
MTFALAYFPQSAYDMVLETLIDRQSEIIIDANVVLE